jgi:hypothetical protein
MPLRWTSVLFTTLRFFLLGIVLPLAGVHLWIAVAHQGLWGAVRKILAVLARALAPQPVLIYTVGLLVFGLLPYFLIFTRTPIKNGWAELLIFGLRLALAFVLTLWGWIITVGALARTSGFQGAGTETEAATPVVPPEAAQSQA